MYQHSHSAVRRVRQRSNMLSSTAEHVLMFHRNAHTHTHTHTHEPMYEADKSTIVAVYCFLKISFNGYSAHELHTPSASTLQFHSNTNTKHQVKNKR